MTGIRIEFSDQQIENLMLAIVRGKGGIDDVELDETVVRLADFCRQKLAGGAMARLVLDGRLAVRWDPEIDDWRVWNIDDPRVGRVSPDRGRNLNVEIFDLFVHDDRWRTLDEVASDACVRRSEAKSVLAELTRRGDLVFEVGPEGRHGFAKCWRMGDADA